MRVVVIRRVKPLPFGGIIIPLISIIIGILLSALVLYGVGVPPDIYFSTIATSFLSPQILRSFVLLTALGAALILSFSGAVWNIGAEGQMIWGMIGAGYIGVFVAASSYYISPSELPIYQAMPGVMILDVSPTKPVISVLHMAPPLGQALMILVAILLGGLWALIAGSLKAFLEIDEVASTLILNYIAYFSFNYLVSEPLRGLSVQAKQFLRTDALHYALRFVRIPVPGTTVTYMEVALAVGVFIIVWFLLKYTTLGLRLKILGSNPNALKAAGVSTRKYIIIALTLSGLIAGSVGAMIFGANFYRLEKIDNIVTPPTQNMGYTAILVSWLSMLDIRAVPVSAYIVAALMQAGSELQARLGTGGVSGIVSGSAITYTLIGFVLITFTILRVFTEYELKFVRGEKSGE